MRGFRGIRLFLLAAAVVVGLLSASTTIDAQTKKRKRRTSTPAVKTTPKTTSGDASVVSRADDLTDLVTLPSTSTTRQTTELDPTTKSIDDLRERLKALENISKSDPDAKQKRLSLNLDILTRAEQRADGLRKQFFEMIEKENSISGRLDVIEIEIRPEAIERTLATTGSLRPEELRLQKRKTLELERTNLQTLLAEVRRNKASIEQNLQKADLLVDRLRSRLEKEIDNALSDENDKPEQ